MTTRTIIGAVGGIVGFIYGGPAGASLGWSLGSIAGNVVDPMVLKGPGLGDIAQQTAQEGGPRPIVHGMSQPITGNVIATSEVSRVTQSSGGKGSPKTESEHAYRTYAIGVCEGPIGGFLRVWRNNILVYDATDTEFTDPIGIGGSGLLGGILDSFTESRNSTFLKTARFFLGTYDQEPSPDLEAVFGVGLTAAHRGTVYMVQAEEDVTDMAGAIPQWQFQVSAGVPEDLMGILNWYTSDAKALVYDSDCNLLSETVIPADAVELFRAPQQESTYYALYYSVRTAGYDTNSRIIVRRLKVYPDGTLELEDEVEFALADHGFLAGDLVVSAGVMAPESDNYLLFHLRLDASPGSYAILWLDPETGESNYVVMAGSVLSTTVLGQSVTGGSVSGSTMVPTIPGKGWVATNGDMYWNFSTATIAGIANTPVVNHINIFDNAGTTASPDVIAVGAADTYPAGTILRNVLYHYEGKSGYWARFSGGDEMMIRAYPLVLPGINFDSDNIDGMNYNSFTGVGVAVIITVVNSPTKYSYYQLAEAGPILLYATSNSTPPNGFVVMTDRVIFQRGTSPADMRYVQVALDTAEVISDETIPQTLDDEDWGNAGNSSVYSVAFPFHTPRLLEVCTSLQSIVAAICDRAGIPTDRYDVSTLDEICVKGLTIINRYPAAKAIQSLADIYRFDITAYDGKIRFIHRGGSSVATVTEDDMVDDDLELEQETREDALGVPRVLNLNYYDADTGGLTTAKQVSERLVYGRSVVSASLQSAVVMTTETAAQAIDILHKTLAEESRGELRFNLPDEFLFLVPTNIIVLVREGVSDRVRINAVDTLDGYQSYVGVRDRLSANTSVAEGVTPPLPTTPPSTVAGPTVFLPLDIPLLQDLDDAVGLGIYGAASGVFNSWGGAAIELSLDGGTTYSESYSATTAAIIGVLTEILEDAPHEYPDENGQLIFQMLLEDSDLEPSTLAGMMNRVNLAAVGNPTTGWELINFANAEQNLDGTWTLSSLLRGRKGTEAKQHAVDDFFVLLDRSRISLIPRSSSEIGSVLTIRATSSGESTEEGLITTMTFVGNTQVERAPAYISAIKVDENIIVSWQGVGRLGSGVDVLHSVNFTQYRLTISDGEHTPVVVYTQEQSYTTNINGLGLNSPFTIAVAQLNQLTGAGPEESITAEFSDLVPVTYPTRTYDIEFSGTPAGTEEFYVDISLVPLSGPTTEQLVTTIDSAGKTTAADYADDLAAQISLAFNTSVIVTQPTADSVRIEVSDGQSMLVNVTPIHPYGVTRTVRDYGPAQDSTQQVAALELYSVNGSIIDPAPAQSNVYRQGGQASINFTIYGNKFETQEEVNYGLQRTALWTVASNISDQKIVSLQGALTPLQSSAYAQYFQIVSSTTLPDGRTAIGVWVKDGYYIGETNYASSSSGAHPSGYKPAFEESIEGVPGYPDGKKRMDLAYFTPQFNVGPSPSLFAAGQDVIITLDGTPYSHTLTSDEADAMNYTGSASPAIVAFINGVYDALETLIDASGDFDILYELYSNGLYKNWRIERNVANTDFTIETEVTGFDLSVEVTAS